MGMISDLKNLSSVDPTLDAVATKRVLKRYIENLEARVGDPAYINEVAANNEVNAIAQHIPTVSAGTYDLTFETFIGETFSVTGIAFNATPATVKTGINSAANGVVTGWVDNDISVGGAALSAGEMLFTFMGSVGSQRLALTIIDGSNLTGGGSAGLVTVPNFGRPNRPAAAVAKLIGLINFAHPIGTLPLDTEYADAKPGDLYLNPDELVLKMLATEIGIETGKFSVGGEAIRNEHLRLMRKQGFAV